MIGRRGFLKAIGVGVLGLSLALRGPQSKYRFEPPPEEITVSDDTGMSVRFIKNWDAAESQMVNKFDVLYGFGKLEPNNVAVRMTDAPKWWERLFRGAW